jgi:hypothetical protein
LRTSGDRREGGFGLGFDRWLGGGAGRDRAWECGEKRRGVDGGEDFARLGVELFDVSRFHINVEITFGKIDAIGRSKFVESNGEIVTVPAARGAEVAAEDGDGGL